MGFEAWIDYAGARDVSMRIRGFVAGLGLAAYNREFEQSLWRMFDED